MLKRLARRLIVLFVLVAALVALSYNPAEQKASAVFPCEECEQRYENCLASCAPCSTAAVNQCANRYNICLANCE
jgi:hypothetical protein